MSIRNLLAIPVAAVAALLLVSGCTAAPDLAAEPTPTPTPAPTSALADQVTTQSSALQPVRQAVPPTRVQIPGVAVDIAVEPVGVRPDGLMEVPANVDVGGWYKFGSDPGSETGTTVISAHVDSIEYGLGPFSQLKNLGVGAEIAVTSADGSVKSYTVESVQSILKDQMPLADVFEREGSPRLILITCGGQFDSTQLDYSDNVVVVAVPVA